MNVFEAVDSRISCRWFLDTPVDPALVRDLIAGAARGIRRQSAALAGLRADRRGAGRTQATSVGFDRRPRPASRGCGISDLSENDVEPYQSRRDHHGV